MPTLALILAIATALAAAIVPLFFGARKPGYSHIRDTISELGEMGSPIGWSVSYLGFLPIGALEYVGAAGAFSTLERSFSASS